MKKLILIACLFSFKFAVAATPQSTGGVLAPAKIQSRPVHWIQFLDWNLGDGTYSPNRLAVESYASTTDGLQGQSRMAWVVAVKNPTGDSVIGDITVEVDPSKTPNKETATPFMVGQMIENTVYRIHVQIAGRSESDANPREQFLIYYGPKRSVTPPIEFRIFRNQAWDNISTAEEQLTEGMKVYRKLCAEEPVECKSGHSAWSFKETYLKPTQEHNRPGHLDLYFELRTALGLEKELEELLMKGADLSLEKKKQLLAAYQAIAARYTPRPGARPGADYELLFLNKVKRNARLLKLDIQAGK